MRIPRSSTIISPIPRRLFPILILVLLGIVSAGQRLQAETMAEWQRESTRKSNERADDAWRKERREDANRSSSSWSGMVADEELAQPAPGVGAMSREQIRLIDANWQRMKAENEAQARANADAERRRALTRQFQDGRQLMGYLPAHHPDFVRGLAMVRAAANGGDPDARFHMARLMVTGDGVERDPAGSRRIFQQLSADGMYLATARLAELMLAGRGGERDVRLAARLSVLEAQQSKGFSGQRANDLPKDGEGHPRYDDAALAQWCARIAGGGNGDASCALAEMLVAGRGVPKDPTRALWLWLFAAESMTSDSRPEARQALAAALPGLLSATPPDHELTQRIYSCLAEAGDADACYHLGLLVLTRTVSDRDPIVRGGKLLDQAKAAGHVAAGKLQLDGQAPPTDPAERCAWHSYRANAGDPKAVFAFAMCCEDGIGRPQDTVLAAVWFAKVAAVNATARQKLERYVATVDTMFSTPTLARGWLVQCGEAGVVAAAVRLAQLSAEGPPPDPVAEVVWLVKAAEGGDLSSRLQIVERHGAIVDQEAFFRPLPGGMRFRWIQQVALRGTGTQAGIDAAYDLGMLYAQGEGPGGITTPSQSWLEKAADAGHVEATFEIVEAQRGHWCAIREHDPRVAIDGTVVQRRLRGLLGSADAKVVGRAAGLLLAMSFAGEGVPLAFAEMRVLAGAYAKIDHSDDGTCHALALAFDRGTATDAPDRVQAFDWFIRSAGAGNADDPLEIAHRLFAGLGCTRDQEAGLRWLTQAAEAGGSGFGTGAAARFEIANLHVSGERGVVKDPELAFRWFHKASDCGHEAATLEIGRRYEAGDGVERAPEKAVELYEYGAEMEKPEFLYRLGLCLERGVGIGKDIGRARTCFTTAAKAGHAGAQQRLAVLGR